MIELISREEKTNLSCRRIPNDLGRSILKEMKFNSSFLKCKGHIATSFQRVQYDKGGE